MKKISVALATFNEEENIGRCLESVKDLADEIVIVDGTSSDKTVEIAKKFGAKVKVTDNPPNFHINKQKALDMATGDWILQLDADETISPELAHEIREVINKKDEFNGYWVPRKNYFLGRFLKKGGQYPDYTIRLYKKNKGKLPQKDVHEQAEVEGKVGYLKNPLLHYPYKNFSVYLKKWDRYNTFIAGQIKDELKNKNAFQKILFGIGYLIVRPAHWMLTTYIRHKGFVDSWQGFVFSLFSALRFPVSYLKYLGFFNSSLIAIVFLSIFLRFYDFSLRWGLSGDDARDAMIALESIKRLELPLAGSFSSSGPFVFGGLFYWFIILSYLALPFILSAPWIMTSIVGVLTVVVLMYIGKEIGGVKLSIIMGLLSATSSQLLARSSVLTQHTFVSTFTSLLILSLLILWRTKQKRYAFLSGLFLGLAIAFHYQALNLLVFLPAVFFLLPLKPKDRFISFLLMLIGFIIPSIPMLYWDSFQNFANIRNVADYFLIGQYRFYVPNSWKIFILNQMPTYWAFVVGKYQPIGLFFLIVSPILIVYEFIKKRLNYKLVFLFLIFFIFLILSRYYKGEKSEGYFLYLIPFILLVTGWFINLLIDKKNFLKYIGFFILTLLIITNLIANWISINYRNRVKLFNETAKILYNKYPNTKFSIYDYKYKLYATSMPMSLIVGFNGKGDVNGKKIGINCYEKECPKNLKIITKNNIFLVVDLEKEKIDKNTWVNVNQVSVYEDLIGYLNKHQMKSTFSLSSFLFHR